MNIEKLAKHLKEFTIDEIEMISECDCKTELEHLLNSNKIMFEQGVYKYVGIYNTETYEVFTIQKGINKNIQVEIAFDKFLNEYVKLNCKKSTYVRYRSVIKYNLLPYFGSKTLNEICNDDIKKLYEEYKSRNLPPKTIRNNLSLLNQIIKYYQNLGVIDRKCIFQVKRLTDKNKFYIDRIIFE